MHTVTVKKKAMNLKESEEGDTGGFERRTGKGEMLQLNYNFRNLKKEI